MFDDKKKLVESAWENRQLLESDDVRQVICAVVDDLDKGVLRCAEPVDLENSKWQTIEWVKKAVLLYFAIQSMRTMHAGDFEWFDKIGVKTKKRKDRHAATIFSFHYYWNVLL